MVSIRVHACRTCWTRQQWARKIVAEVAGAALTFQDLDESDLSYVAKQ